MATPRSSRNVKPEHAQVAQQAAPEHTPAGLFRALDTFFWKGTVLVNRGDTVAAGHPMLKGREHLFEAFAPTFPSE